LISDILVNLYFREEDFVNDLKNAWKKTISNKAHLKQEKNAQLKKPELQSIENIDEFQGSQASINRKFDLKKINLDKNRGLRYSMSKSSVVIIVVLAIVCCILLLFGMIWYFYLKNQTSELIIYSF